jgi:hypothetical protein
MSGIGWKSSLQRPASPGRHGSPQQRRAAARAEARAGAISPDPTHPHRPGRRSRSSGPRRQRYAHSERRLIVAAAARRS